MFNWKGSHKADRAELLKGIIPSISEVIHQIDISGATQEEKSLLYIMIMTSCRVSEACRVKCEDVHIYLKPNYEINFDNSKNYSIDPRSNTVIDRFDIDRVIFQLDNLKRKNKNAQKAVSCINNELFTMALWHIIQHMRSLNKPKALIYSKGRRCAWWIFKKYDNINKVTPFPHSMRHIALSNLTKAGVPPGYVQRMAGWSNLNPFSVYTHLATTDLENQLRKVYGDSLEKLSDNNKPPGATKLAGAHLAAFEVGRTQSKQKTTPVNYEHGRPQNYIYSTILHDDKMSTIKTIPKTRAIADKIRAENPEIKKFNDELRIKAFKLAGKPLPVKKKEFVEDEFLQVV